MSSRSACVRRRPASRRFLATPPCDARAPRLAGRREDGGGVVSRRMRRPDAVLLHERVGENEELPHHGRQRDFGWLPRATSASYLRLRSGLCRTATSAGM